ncbi:MOB kinase activator-like 3 [Convolutriloba macropyga]|uniref:MOB kinase activator-like 3 n=1 Tax=Convolutriloba macropyga TaxID=536237 RepID=UPI003F51C865
MSYIKGLVRGKKDQTFRPKKKFEDGSGHSSLHKYAKASLKAGLDFAEIVKLPPKEERNDWLAVHVVDFFNRVNLIYGVISEYCTVTTCPKMSGGTKFEYFWADETNKKPTALPAPEYMTHLMDWIESKINNPKEFPTTTDVPFPKHFPALCKKILTRLYRVFIHVYIHHFEPIVSLGSEAHVNQCYKHFVYFVTEFHMVDYKEFEPLAKVTDQLCPGRMALLKEGK